MKKIKTRKRGTVWDYDPEYVYMAPEEYIGDMLSDVGIEGKLERLSHIVPALVGLLVRKGIISNSKEFNELLPYDYYGVELVDVEETKKSDQ